MPGAEMWNERFATEGAAYGTVANDFVRAVAAGIPEGPVLVIGAGEGRNAVYLAELGHEVTAIDLSDVGLRHALALAERRGTTLNTRVQDLADAELGEEEWAGIVSVWTHLPPDLRRDVMTRCVRALRPGGVFVLEAYAPAHLQRPGFGGPPVEAMLMSAEGLRQELGGLQFLLCQEVEREVSEGRDHQGPSTTTQVLASKPA